MFIRTKRLLLRPGWPDDTPALAAAMSEQGVFWPHAVGDSKALSSKAPKSLPSFLIFERTSHVPVLVGGIGLCRAPDGDVELGFWITSASWSRGIVVEAGHAVVALARDGLRLRRIVSGHSIGDPAGAQALETLGFAATGEMAWQPSRARGEAVPMLRYALELSAWRDAGAKRLAA